MLSDVADVTVSASVFEDRQETEIGGSSDISTGVNPSAPSFLPRPSSERSMERQTLLSFNRAIAGPSIPEDPKANSVTGDADGQAVAGPSGTQEEIAEGEASGEKKDGETAKAKAKGKTKAISRTSSKAKVADAAPNTPDLPVATSLQYFDLGLREPVDGEGATLFRTKAIYNIGRLSGLLWHLTDNFGVHRQTTEQAIKVLSQSAEDRSLDHSSSSLPPSVLMSNATNPLADTAFSAMPEQVETLMMQQINTDARMVSLEEWTIGVGHGYDGIHDTLADVTKMVSVLEKKLGTLEDEREALVKRVNVLESARMPPPALSPTIPALSALAPARMTSAPVASGTSLARPFSPLPPVQRTYNHVQRQWVSTTSSPATPSTSSSVTASTTVPAVTRAATAGSTRTATGSSSPAKRHKSNSGRPHPVPVPTFDLLFTFPAVQPDPLRSIRALVVGVLPMVDASAVCGFEQTDSPLTYLGLFHNTGSGSGPDVARRFMGEWQKLPASSNYRAMEVDWGSRKDSSSAVDAMVKGLPLA